MKNFVISLKSSQDRRTHITQEFGRQNIPFEFFDAITPDEAQPLANQLGITLGNADLTAGEKACLMSHVAVWQKIMESDLAYAAVFEDDVILSQSSHLFLSSPAWIPTGVDIIKLEYFDKRVYLCSHPLKLGTGTHRLYRIKEHHIGAAGYLVSKKGVAEFMRTIKQTSELKAIDHIIFEEYIALNRLPVYQLFPAICMQSNLTINNLINLPSSLEKDRRIRLTKHNALINYQQKPNYAKKILREIKRPFIQIKSLTLAKLLSKRMRFG